MKVKKRLLMLACFLACSSLLLLSACGQVETTANGSHDKASTKVAGSAQSAGESKSIEYEITQAQTFHDGLAWVVFSPKGSSASEGKYGVIDKEGNVRLAFSEFDDPRLLMPTAFEDGYSFAKEGDGSVYSISTKGGTVHFGDEDEKVLSYGGGVVITMTNIKNFDSNYYSYCIYKADGTKLKTVESEDESEVSYRGHGVFWFSQLDPAIYCSKSDKWINVDVDTFNTGDFEFIDDCDKAYAGVSTDGRNGLLVSDTGEITSFAIPGEPAGSGSVVSDNKVVLLVDAAGGDGSQTFAVYNLEDGSMKEMPAEYAAQVDFGAYIKSAPMYHDGVLLLSVTGADDEPYIEAFDEDWNRLFQPIQGHIGYDGTKIASEDAVEIQANEGVVTTTDYGLDGAKRFEVQGSLSPLMDGAHLHSATDDARAGGVGEVSSPFTYYQAATAIAGFSSSANRNPEYLDKDGNLLFKSLNVNGAKTVTFK